MYDVIIKGGKLVDGLGGKAVIADIAVKDGYIAEIASAIDAEAKEVINASGAIVTPGFVDVHTHYDGQVSWDDEMDPSASHGVTSVVMGNCGVGFAPVPKGGEHDLIDVMEGVEDIPGTALYEGIDWGAWETFPEYLDYIDKRQYAINIGTQIPHAAVRNYVMGQRGRDNDPATDEEIEIMKRIVKEGMEAGALGFSTSRTIGHRAASGASIPGTFAEDKEIMTLCTALEELEKGVFELIPASVIGDMEQQGGEKFTVEEELDLMTRISEDTGRPVTFSLLQHAFESEKWKEVLDSVSERNAKGAQLRPQIASKPIGLITNLKTYHMFQRKPTFLKLSEELSFEELVTEMHKPEVKAAILSEEDAPPQLEFTMDNMFKVFSIAGAMIFEVEDPIDYEPTADKSFTARAEQEQKSYPEFMYDFLIAEGGSKFGVLLGSNFVDFTHNAIYDMLKHPDSITGLSDAGAHVTIIADGVAPTHQLTHWTRDRSRGDTLPLEFIVHKQSYVNAELYGLHDRGSIEVGKRADINVIDYDNLKLGGMEIHSDLPAGGKRLLQPASGYIATYVNGVKTREFDKDTGARPGRLLRS